MVDEATIADKAKVTIDASSRDFGHKRTVQGQYQNDGKVGKLVEKNNTVVVEKMDDFNVGAKGSAHLNGDVEVDKMHNAGTVASKSGNLKVNSLKQTASGKTKSLIKRNTKAMMLDIQGEVDIQGESKVFIDKVKINQNGAVKTEKSSFSYLLN